VKETNKHKQTKKRGTKQGVRVEQFVVVGYLFPPPHLLLLLLLLPPFLPLALRVPNHCRFTACSRTFCFARYTNCLLNQQINIFLSKPLPRKPPHKPRHTPRKHRR
jgi:hypothetical protein